MAKSEKTQTLHAPAGTQKSTELFDTIAWLRAFLSAGVVAIHVHYFDSAQIGAKNFYDFYRLFTNVCVPAFFFISGCLFFRGNAFSTAIYIDKLKKRSRSLLLPYILFNYFAMVVWAILIFGFGLHTNTQSFEGMTVFDYLGITKSYAALWFVNNLIILAIISPLIYWAIKKMGIVFLILAGTYLVSPKPFGGLEFLGGVGIFWFSLGAFVSLNKIDFIHAIKNLNKWILLLIWALFTTFYLSLRNFSRKNHWNRNWNCRLFYLGKLSLKSLWRSRLGKISCRSIDVYLLRSRLNSQIIFRCNFQIPLRKFFTTQFIKRGNNYYS